MKPMHISIYSAELADIFLSKHTTVLCLIFSLNIVRSHSFVFFPPTVSLVLSLSPLKILTVLKRCLAQGHEELMSPQVEADQRKTDHRGRP